MSVPREPAKAPSLGELASAAAFVVVLISAWLYATGWTYAYHYFDRFGIPLLMVDIPKEHYFVYGRGVLEQFPVWALSVGIASIVLVGTWRWVSPLLRRLALPLGVLVVLALFWLGHQAGVSAAHEQSQVQRESDYSAYSRVQVWTNEDAKVPAGSPLVSADLTQGCYRLLLHNQDRLFLIRPFKGAPAADMPVLILPWKQASVIRVLPEYTSCR